MATLSLKPNSRKTPPLEKAKAPSTDWEMNDVGVMRHTSGFSIQFFNSEECEIINIPKDMSLTTIREMTTKAIQARKRPTDKPRNQDHQ